MSADQWYPEARRIDGNPHAHGYPGEQEPGHKAGAVYHSAEGALATMLRIISAPGEPSWTFSNPKRGTLIQHYGVGEYTWANGTRGANILYVSCESEGLAGEALTESQVQNLVDLTRWLKKRFGWLRLRRRDTLWEHRELAQTACPSGRIPWTEIMRQAIEEDDEMADEATRRQWAEAAAIFGRAAQYAAQGIRFEDLPADLKGMLRYLLAA